MEYLESAAGQYPELSPTLHDLSSSYKSKLYHQVTDRLRELVRSPPFQQEAAARALYEGFVHKLVKKINKLEWVKIVNTLANTYKGEHKREGTH